MNKISLFKAAKLKNKLKVLEMKLLRNDTCFCMAMNFESADVRLIVFKRCDA